MKFKPIALPPTWGEGFQRRIWGSHPLLNEWLPQIFATELDPFLIYRKEEP